VTSSVGSTGDPHETFVVSWGFPKQARKTATTGMAANKDEEVRKRLMGSREAAARPLPPSPTQPAPLAAVPRACAFTPRAGTCGAW
jgi:hypothetical protein